MLHSTETRAKKRSTLQSILWHPLLPFLLLWLFLAVCHLFFTMGTGDDAFYATIIPTKGLWNHFVEASQLWSARSLIEVIQCIMAWLPHIVWRVLNPIVMTLCAWAISGLLGTRRTAGVNWLLCGLLILYPWQLMDSAGWVSTTSVYLWPAAVALLCLLPTAALLRGQKPGKASCVASVLGLLYAANMELVMIVLLVLLGVLCVWLLAQRWRPPALLLAQLGAVVANLIWFIVCPGAHLRLAMETASWFPNFGMRGLFAKVELGASNALADVFFAPNTIFFFLCLLLLWLVCLRYKSWLYRVVAALPLVLCTALGMFGNVAERLIPALGSLRQAVTGEGSVTLANAGTPLAYLPMLLLYGGFFLLLLGVYLALGNTPSALAAETVLCAGILSRFAMGFSPTVWVSGARTGLFFHLGAIACGGLVYREIQPLAKRWQKLLFFLLLAAYCLVGLYSFQQMRIATGY